MFLFSFAFVPFRFVEPSERIRFFVFLFSGILLHSFLLFMLALVV
ncbi:hypothetical protein HMPREF1981_00851 [Bacteroides pyogenes F0041]|uniref:Uncharacterized protein n=1 Tax=Bacteroides pyogenes F0041 TaxID=1321819 RepID=U2CQ05_9BACE|nr:hypothetical protein HMPREF1981_00851 [Bacteroides pyogenes F0041]